MSGHNSRKRSDVRFSGAFCGITAVYTIVWDAKRALHDATILMPTLFSGTSGFAYPSWKPEFYPEKLAAKKFLSHYATQLNTVEVNFTFRQLVKESTIQNWLQDTPAHFR